MKKYRNIVFAVLSVLLVLGAGGSKAFAAGSLNQSRYVQFSPDGEAWTLKQELPEGTLNGMPVYWYPRGTTVSMGIKSSLRALEAGEHYYLKEKQGEIPVGRWEVAHTFAECIHVLEKYPDYYHGVSFGKEICRNRYFSGWIPYCADCGESITDGGLVYGSREAVSTINAIKTGLEIFYVCPTCSHLEQGIKVKHECKAISYNRYQVKYNKNAKQIGMKDPDIWGVTASSFHMYNNATEYEGKRVTPNTKLTLNGYKVEGYQFIGWNTKPDGSGDFYADGAEIRNLTDQQYDEEKKVGIVTLYAQWRQVETNLIVDPNGGSYLGKKENTLIRKKYGDEYILSSESVVPPDGYTVSFETNGGDSITPERSSFVFDKWELLEPAYGVFLRNVQYLFRGRMDDTDTIRARYAQEPVTLPGAHKDNESFGGWYRDPACTELAGYAGDPFQPEGDTTLYAKWTQLVLHAKDNYTANGGKGAVDLSWAQPDGKNKTYRLYQGKDGVNFKQVYSAQDGVLAQPAQKEWGFDKKAQTFTIPYTGFYELTASGAQGAGYGAKQGGKGGTVTGKFYLTQGEVLTVTTGGTDGTNGGGTASAYGNGGGFTKIVSSQKGTLLIGGGGGGATPGADGGQGGAENGLCGQKPNAAGNGGQGGAAGGGGGYVGGKSAVVGVTTVIFEHRHGSGCSYNCGERDDICTTGGDCRDEGHECHFHDHTAECCSYRESEITLPYTGQYRLEVWGGQGGGSSNHCTGSAAGGAGGYAAGTLTAQAGTALNFGVGRMGKSDSSDQATEDGEVQTANGESGKDSFVKMSGKLLLCAKGGGGGRSVCRHGPDDDDHTPGTSGGATVDSTALSDTAAQAGKNTGSGGVRITYQPMTAGCGGSSYINAQYAVTGSSGSGTQAGDGRASLKTLSVGYQTGQKLDGVATPDLAAPDAIAQGTVSVTDAGSGAVLVAWQEPADNGTAYYHRATSYEAGTEAALCVSNITKNTLVSGIGGYLYRVDADAATKVTWDNGTKQAGRRLTVHLTGTVQYVHLAAVDVAGNLSGTIHVRLDNAKVAWKPFTEPLSVGSVIDGTDYGSVAQAEGERSWYVRADGETPFLVGYAAYMEGQAREDYQINHATLEASTQGEGGHTQKLSVTLPYTRPLLSTAALDTAQFVRGSDGDCVLLSGGMYTVAARSGEASRLTLDESFTIDPAWHGEAIRLVPSAGADFEGGVVLSDSGADGVNGLWLLPDAEPPVIEGLDELYDAQIIDRGNETVRLELTAQDDVSGLDSFTVRIVNRDNYSERLYEAQDGRIEMELTKEDPLFTGDFSVIAYAADRVGNVRQENRDVTEFALEASLERILEPHTPAFKCGESGILTVTVWGYADRVEVRFPEELTRADAQLDKSYVYRFPEYCREEKLEFMVPIDTPDKEDYVIRVYAYKGDWMLTAEPALTTFSVKGSVTDDIRTRLR